MFPQNAAAEYSLGELAREADQYPQAIEHYTRATRLNAGLAEAYFGLGRTFLDSGRAAEAVEPLETAVKLQPENPTIHFSLATAYQRLDRKDDAAREFTLQKSTSEKIRQTSDAAKRSIEGEAGRK